MDNKFVMHLSHSGKIALVNQNRHITGAGVSFLIHGVALCFIIFASSALSNFTPPLVIDFSIEKYDGDMIAKQGVAQFSRQENPPVPEIKPAPPVPQPVPEKVAVVTPDKIEPKKVETVVVVEQLPEKIIPESIIASVEPVVNNRNIYEEKNDLIPAASPIIPPSPSLQKEQYKKEHFDYIEERVKSKITYPRIARKMGWQGKVVVSFVICRDGSVKNIRIVKSSGYKALDNNAIKVIKKVAPFPKPPVAAELTIPVIYKLS